MVVEPVYIWVRATLDWAGEEPVRPRFQPRVDLWNATFDLSFHAFRHRVRKIAQGNLSRIEGTVCAGWEEIPDGALVLPVDDDDWFSPQVGQALRREFDPRVTGYRWTSSWIELPMGLGPRLFGRRLLPWPPPTYTCTTNNYAIAKSESARALLSDHGKASQWFDSRIEGSAERSLKTIDGRLSAANRTLASQTSLRFSNRSMSRSQLIRKFLRFQRLYDRPPPAGLEWCTPYLKQMSELMADLMIRRPR